MKLSEIEVLNLGNILRNERQKQALTLEEVKIKLEDIGQFVNTSDILRMEKGERKIPNAILLKNLCKIYNLDVIKLFEEIGYLDSEKRNNYEIKVYNNLETAYCTPEIYLEKINLNLKEEVIGIKESDNIILIKKTNFVENNQKGIFKKDGKYYLRKKSIISPEEFILLGKEEETPIFIKGDDDFEEVGKVVGKITFI